MRENPEETLTLYPRTTRPGSLFRFASILQRRWAGERRQVRWSWENCLHKLQPQPRPPGSSGTNNRKWKRVNRGRRSLAVAVPVAQPGHVLLKEVVAPRRVSPGRSSRRRPGSPSRETPPPVPLPSDDTCPPPDSRRIADQGAKEEP